MKLVGPHIIVLLGCAFFGLAQRPQFDYLPPNTGGSGNTNIGVPFPTPPRPSPPRPTQPRPTPPRPTQPRPTPPRPTEPRPTPSRPTFTQPRPTPSRPTFTQPRPTPPRPTFTQPSPTPPRPTQPRPTTPRPSTTVDHHHHHDDHHHHHSDDPLQWLRDSVPGEPGDDYPIYWKVPETSFSCDGRGIGLYADVETRCQSFHICTEDAAGNFNYISMLCPNGTIFNQKHFTCEWWTNVECQDTEQFYSLNELIGVVPEGAPSGNFNQRARPDQQRQQQQQRPVQPAPAPAPRQPAPAPAPRQPAPTPAPRQPAPAPRQPAPAPRQPAPAPRQPAPAPRQPIQTPRQPAPSPQRRPSSRPRQPTVTSTNDDSYNYPTPAQNSYGSSGGYGRRF